MFNREARARIQEGVDIVADAVGCTLGPKGHIVAIERPGEAPHLSKDGVTVCRAISLKDQFHNLGAQMIKEVASRTVDVAGDGTTTATLLAQAIYNNGLKLLAAKHKSTEIKKGVDWAVEQVCINLDEMAMPIRERQDIVHVGTVSSNGDKSIGNLLADAMDKVGSEGVITVEEAKGYATSLEVVEGMQLDRGYVSAFFVNNNEKMTCEFIEPYIYISNEKLVTVDNIQHVLQQIHNVKRPLLIMADEIEGEALHMLTVNKLKGVLQVCAIRSPGFGSSRLEYLQDVSVLTGGQVISPSTGIKQEDIDLNDPSTKILGTCKKVIIGKSVTTIVGSSEQDEVVATRCEEIRTQLEDPSLTEYDENILKERLSKLSGGVAIIRVGGSTEVELKERKDRVEDALCATQAAVEAGIAVGGGVALVKASSNLKAPKGSTSGFSAGVAVIKEACQAPLCRIVSNADHSPELVLDQISKKRGKNIGFNADTGTYGDMIEFGIIDPVKVPRTALQNAASVAGLMLTIDCAVVEEDQQQIVMGVA
jgi:chaperonin GroEL